MRNVFNSSRITSLIIFFFSDLPEDEDWNFVEINSTSDLLALENPKQRKVKSQEKVKGLTRKAAKNNWNLFKHKFPVFVNKTETSGARKDKRHVLPSELLSQTKKELGDPWAKVNIQSLDNHNLTFGSYDEYGQKLHTQIQERLIIDNGNDNDYANQEADHEIEDIKKVHDEKEVFLNITFDLNKINDQNVSESVRNNQTSSSNDDDDAVDRVNAALSDKLEQLYEKLAELKTIEAKLSQTTPLPPRGRVEKLKKPIAVIMRQQESPIYASNAFKTFSYSTPRQAYQFSPPTPPPTPFTKLKSELRGLELTPRKPRRSVFSFLKDQLDQLVPSIFEERSSNVKQQQLLPTLPPVYLPHTQSFAPPWSHHGVPQELQRRMTPTTPHQKPVRQERTLLDFIMPL